MTDADKPFYPSGHDQTVLRSHRTRNAANSAPHLLPHLRSSDSLLDIGCGPGTITCSLAKHVARVVGVEHPGAGEAVLEGAKEEAKMQGVADKVSFEFADALRLPYEDNSFDVVYCHQVRSLRLQSQRFLALLSDTLLAFATTKLIISLCRFCNTSPIRSLSCARCAASPVASYAPAKPTAVPCRSTRPTPPAPSPASTRSGTPSRAQEGANPMRVGD